MKKGFTLAEMLGVIILMAILAAIIYPNIASQYKKRTDELSDSKEKILCSAVNDYCIEENLSNCAISVTTIDNDGKLPFDIENLKDEDGNIKAKYSTITVTNFGQSTYNCNF